MSAISAILQPKQSIHGILQPATTQQSDYNKLNNKPKINGVELSGDVSLEDFDVAESADTLAGYGITDAYTKTEVDAKETALNTKITNATTKNAEEITNVKADLNLTVNWMNPINLLSGVWTNGYLINAQGVVTENSAYSYSDYFEVTPGKMVCCTQQQTATSRVKNTEATAFYDDTHTFIFRATGEIKTVPENAKYARQNLQTIYTSGNYKPMVEYTNSAGTIASNYSAWFEPFYSLTPNYGADFNDKKLCVFGDSLAANGNTGDNAWINIVGNTLGFKQVYNRGIGSTRVGETVTMYAYVDADGCAYMRTGYTTRQTLPDYTEINACISSTDRANTIPTDTDIVIVLAGANDPGSISADNFETAYKTMLDNIYARVPDARIILGTLLYNHNWDSSSDVAPVYNNFRSKIKSVGAMYGYPVIDFRAEMMVNDLNWSNYMDSDGVHFNTKTVGKNRIAETAIPHVHDIKYIR